MALSRTSSRTSTGRIYDAASSLRSIDSPEGYNSYLRTILDPAHHSSGIPDDDQTRRVIKHNTISHTIRVPDTDMEVMIIYTPKSKGPVITVYVRPTNYGPWGYLIQVDKSDPLYQSYSLARNVAGMLQIYSATLPAGAFSINGSVNGVYTTSLPPFSALNFDQILSYAAGSSFVSVGDGIVDGQVHLAVPNGKNPYTPPLPPFSAMFDPAPIPSAISVPNCAIPAGAAVAQKSYTISGPLAVTHVAPATVQTLILDLSGSTVPALQDPLTGWFKVSLGFEVTSSFVYDARVYLEVETVVADPGTWVLSTIAKGFPMGMVKLNNQPYDDIFYGQTYEFLYIPSQVSRIKVFLQYTTPAGGTLTVSNRRLSLQNYSFYTEETQPASIAIVQGLDPGTQLKLVGISIDECVPKAELSRDLTAVPGVEDDLEAEIAEARLSAGDVPMVLNRAAYNAMIMNGTFDRLATGSSLYKAASVGKLARKIRSRWDALSPAQQQALKDMGSAAGLALNTFTGGALTPFIQAATPLVQAANAFPSYHASSETPPNSQPLPGFRVLLASNPHEARALVQQYCPKFAVQAHHGTNIMRVSPSGRVYVAAETTEKAEEFLKVCLKSKGYSASSPAEEFPFDFSSMPGSNIREVEDMPPPESAPRSPKRGPPREEETEEASEQSVTATVTRIVSNENVSARNYFMLLPDPSNQSAPTLISSVARYGRPPKILDDSGEPVPVRWETTTWGKVTFHFPSDYWDKNPSWFMAMAKLAGHAGEVGNFYVTTTRVLPEFDGDSWQLAWAATILGVTVKECIITGGVALDSAFNPVTTKVTRLGEKLQAAKEAGKRLVFPSANTSDVLEELGDGEVLTTSAYSWRSRALPQNTVAVAIGCVQDLLLYTKTSTQIVSRSNRVGEEVVPKKALPPNLEQVIASLTEASTPMGEQTLSNVRKMASQLRLSYAAFQKAAAIPKAQRSKGEDALVIQFHNLVDKMEALTITRREAQKYQQGLQERKKQAQTGTTKREDGSVVGNKKTRKTAEQRKRRKERAQQLAKPRQSDTYEFDFDS